MSDDKRSRADGHPGQPAAAGDSTDVLRRAAHDVRAAAALQAFVPLSTQEREQLADRAIEHVLGPAAPRASEPVAPRWWRRRSVAVIGAATAALAAAIALLVVRGPRPAEPLARYAMVVEGEQR